MHPSLIDVHDHGACTRHRLCRIVLKKRLNATGAAGAPSLPWERPRPRYLSSFSSACTFRAWYLCSSFFTRDRYSCAHFFSTSSF